MRSVFIVDDKEMTARLAAAWFEQIGFMTKVANDAVSAFSAILEGFSPTLLFTDIAMPGAFDGFELAMRVRDSRPAIKILLTTGWVEPQHSIFDVLPKPYGFSDLDDWIRENMEPDHA